MKMSWIVCCAAALVIIGYYPTSACKVSADYLRPSNYELVKLADSIVVARASKFDNKPGEIGTVTFQILEVLKGNFNGLYLDINGYDGFLGDSKSGDFSEPRPGALAGSCIAMDYRRGTLYLLFLKKSGEGDSATWAMLSEPFSRVNEEINLASPWLETVRQYVHIGNLRDYEKEKKALYELKSQVEKDNSEYSIALTQDIDSYFSTPSDLKSCEDRSKVSISRISFQDRSKRRRSPAPNGSRQYSESG